MIRRRYRMTTVAVARMSIPPAMPVPIPGAAPIVAVIPGASADKDSTIEPARPIVAVRGAGVRVIRIIAVTTNRRTVGIAIIASHHRPHADADRHLGVSKRRRDECEKTEQQ
jgi:hypothetical protein